MAEESTDQAPDIEEKKSKNYLKTGIIVGVVILGAIGLFKLLGNGSGGSGSGSTEISGVVNFNGLKPPTDVADEDRIGKMVLMQREFGTEEYTVTDTEISMQDDALWTWTGAESGTTYDIRVDLFVGDDLIKSSSTVTTTAPSTGQILILNVTLEDLPDYVLDELEASISGSIDLNGYVPSGSVISILQRKTGSGADFKLATNEVEVSDGAKWSWDNPEAGVSYDLRADLTSSSNVLIGRSDVVSAVAPASGEVLRIVSTATAPGAEAQSISGTVTINGAVVEGTTLLMLQRKTGEKEYTEFDRLEPVSGAKWDFADALSGQSYDITSALQLDGENVTSGSTVIATALAKDEKIVIDTSLSLSAPPKGTATCGDRDSTGNYNAVVSYAEVKNVQGYFAQVGTTAGGNDVYSEYIIPPADNSGPNIDVFVKENVDYFTQYAYTYCSTCNQHDTQNWSSWSPTLGFKCPE